MKSFLKEIAAFVKQPLHGLWLVVWLVAASQAYAQNVPLLERTVTLELSDEPVEKALKKIGKEAKLTFSYVSADINIEQNVTASVKAKTVRETLELIFGGTVSFKEKSNYIILVKVPPAPVKTGSIEIPKRNPLFINGYVLNVATGEKLAGVSVYDTRTLTAAVTNNFGYFNIMLKEPDAENTLAVSRKSFFDTTIVINTDTYVYLTIPLRSELQPTAPRTALPDTLDSLTQIAAAVIPDTTHGEETVNPDTLTKTTEILEPVWNSTPKDTLYYRKGQLSMLPFAGTNGRDSDKTINDFSINLLGGYSAGTTKFEFGTLFNIDLLDVSYMQVAGLMNFNEGRMNGFQIAGLFNTNRKGIKGFQIAGITNVNNGRSQGMQVAGITNIQTKQFRGMQLAGIANFSERRMRGLQVAPVFNYASNLKGMQIGFINVADTLHGVPIGFISYVRNGYHKLEFAADEIFYANVAFRTGTYKFYNIFTFGFKPQSDPRDEDRDTEWTFGYGFGTAPYIFDWLNLNIDLTVNQLNKGGVTGSMNLLNKAYFGLEIQPFDRIGFSFGVTLNAHIIKASNSYDIFTNYRPEFIKDREFNDKRLMMWWGYKAAIRFF